MKKYFLTVMMFLVGMIFLPEKASAQYNIMSGYYTTDLAIKAAIAGRKADSMRRKKRTVKRKAVRKRVVRKKARRTSALENIVEPKYKINSNLPRRIEIV